jgi:hypothetical protein
MELNYRRYEPLSPAKLDAIHYASDASIQIMNTATAAKPLILLQLSLADI